MGAGGINLGMDDFSAEICKMSEKRRPGKRWGVVSYGRARHQEETKPRSMPAAWGVWQSSAAHLCKGRIVQALLCHTQELGLYPEGN